MKIKPQIAILLVLLIFFAGIALAKSAGVWSTETEKKVSKFESGEKAGEYNPSDIRGSFLFKDISEIFKIPLEELDYAFGVNESASSSFKCKDIESVYAASQYDIGTESVRIFTAFYLGLPYEPKEESYLPETASQILRQKGNMTQEQLDYLESHTVKDD